MNGLNIIIPPKEYTEGDRALALQHEFRTGWQFLKATEEARETQARAQAQPLKSHKAIPGLGRCIRVTPEWEHFRLIQKYGRHEVHSKEFQKYYEKKFPELTPHKI